MVAARLDEPAATPTVTLRGLIAACRQESSGVSEGRRLDERPRKVKYTRASPELASFVRPGRGVSGASCTVYSVKSVPSWCVCPFGRSRSGVCLHSIMSVFLSLLPHRTSTDTARAIDRMMMLAQKSISSACRGAGKNTAVLARAVARAQT